MEIIWIVGFAVMAILIYITMKNSESLVNDEFAADFIDWCGKSGWSYLKSGEWINWSGERATARELINKYKLFIKTIGNYEQRTKFKNT